jgi:hypothetical protein
MSTESSGAGGRSGAAEAEPDAACQYCCARYPSSEIVEFIAEGGDPLCPRCGIDCVIFAKNFGGVLPDEAWLRRQRAAGWGIPEDEPIVPIIRINLQAVVASMEARAAGREGAIDEATCHAALAHVYAWFDAASDAQGEGDALPAASDGDAEPD